MQGEIHTQRVLELGCGKNKTAGAIGLDMNPDATAANVIADIDKTLPFADNSFDEVRGIHLIEHVGDIMRVMSEIHRVTRRNGTVFLVTPHFTDLISWSDPTHRWHLSTLSFRHFDLIHGRRHWYTRLVLRQTGLHVELARLWKWLGLQWLVNHLRWFRRFWEVYLCLIVRGKQMEFTFQVVK